MSTWFQNSASSVAGNVVFFGLFRLLRNGKVVAFDARSNFCFFEGCAIPTRVRAISLDKPVAELGAVVLLQNSAEAEALEHGLKVLVCQISRVVQTSQRQDDVELARKDPLQRRTEMQ